MTQSWIVALIVAGAAAYAVWYWLPARLRRRLGRVHQALAKVPGCSDCSSSCGGCAQAGGDSGADPEPGGKRVIPIASRPSGPASVSPLREERRT
jgi:hypothetical protein